MAATPETPQTIRTRGAVAPPPSRRGVGRSGAGRFLRALLPRHRRWRRRHRTLSRLFSALVLVFLVAGGLIGVLALSGRTITLPDWAVAEVEARLNASLDGRGASGVSSYAVSVGGAEIVVAEDWVPRIGLSDVRLLGSGGATTLAVLPDLRVTLDAAALAGGALRPDSVEVLGPVLAVTRRADGRLDVALDGRSAAPAARLGTGFATPGAALDRLEAVLTLPALADLDTVRVSDLTLSVTDAASGEVWTVGNGALDLLRAPEGMTAELVATVARTPKAPASGSGGAAFAAVPALAEVRLQTTFADASAEISANLSDLAAADLAAIAPAFGAAGAAETTLSGTLAAALASDGRLAVLSGDLSLGPGMLRAGPRPLAFDAAAVAFTYDPASATVDIARLRADSPAIRLTAEGRVRLMGPTGAALERGRRPSMLLAELDLSDIEADPDGVFDTPVRFPSGALDLRITDAPLRIDLGQMALTGPEGRIDLSGRFAAGATDGEDWTGALDLRVDRIDRDRLLTLWPVTLVPKTRAWLVQNLQASDLFNVQGAVRMASGAEPVLHLGYEFGATDLRVLKAMPPVRDGVGHATLEGKTFTLVVDRGRIDAPKGGAVEVGGSVFRVADITQKPAEARLSLQSRASLTATLSLLDEPPFQFLSKAGRGVELGAGEARLASELAFPLIPKIAPGGVRYAVAGEVRDLRSDILVPGRALDVPVLGVTVDPEGLRLAGAGRLDGVPFEATYRQRFGPDAGPASVEGSVALSQQTLERFGVALPKGSLSGEGRGDVRLSLPRGAPATLALESNLVGLRLAVPALQWRKAADARGALRLEARLGATPEVTALSLTAPDLVAEGRLSLRPGGGLERAEFSRLEAGAWLDASAVLTGQGAGRAPDIALTGGTLDMRRLPAGDGDGGGGAGAGGGPLSLTLDRLQVTDSIAFTDFRGRLEGGGGFRGDFVAGVNGAGRVEGAIAPVEGGGSRVRLRSDDAGRVMRAAGVFSSGRGGALDLRLEGRSGSYVGRADIQRLRVVDAPVLAELLSAVSVIGLLEQLNGEGLSFSDVEVAFRTSGDRVEITRGSAVGASMGVSMAGLYDGASRRIDLSGVISPLYLVNGIGAVLTRRGEGLFGFNYALRGDLDAPQVGVNPLSILTPGMFREIFRRPPPRLEGQGE